MTTQIAVRLPEDLVREIDLLIANGGARSRASIIERALRHELRRLVAERDLAIIAEQGDDDELAALASWSAGTFRIDD